MMMTVLALNTDNPEMLPVIIEDAERFPGAPGEREGIGMKPLMVSTLGMLRTGIYITTKIIAIWTEPEKRKLLALKF